MLKLLLQRLPLLLGLAFTVFVSTASATQEAIEEGTVGMALELFSIQNIVLIAGLIFHFGLLRQELRELRNRADEIPKTYARKDVISESLRDIDRRLTEIEKAVR